MKKTFTWRHFAPFINSQSVAYLSTINKNIPHTRGMLNLSNKANFPKLQKLIETGTLYFTTNKSSSKMLQISKNNSASVYFCDNNTFYGLLLIGKIEVVTDNKVKQSFWQDGWTIYYPKGSGDSEYQLLKFIAKEYRYYDGKFEVYSGEF